MKLSKEQRDVLARLKRAQAKLDAMPTVQAQRRDLIEEAQRQGVPVAEIARQLGVTVGALWKSLGKRKAS